MSGPVAAVPLTRTPSQYWTRAGIVLACTLITAINLTPTVHTVFGSFLIPISTEFGWPRADVTLALVLLSVVQAGSFILLGRMADLYGCRLIIVPGLVLFSATIAAIGLVDASRIQFYSLYAFAGLVGSVAGTVLISKLIVGWFDKSRGLMLGIVGGIGNGVGATAMPFYVQYFIEGFGWRTGYFGLGGLIAVVAILPALLLLRDAPRRARDETQAVDHDHEEGTPWRQAIGMPIFWLLLLTVGAAAGAMTGAFTHVVPIMLDKDFDFTQATTVLSLFALVTVIWQITIGALLDRFPIPRLPLPFFVIGALGVLILQESAEYAPILGSAVMLGIGLGTTYGVLPYFLSRYFGLRDFGMISGIVYGVIVLVQGLVPFMMDAVYDAQGSYRWAMAAVAVALLFSAALTSRLTPFTYLATKPA